MMGPAALTLQRINENEHTAAGIDRDSLVKSAALSLLLGNFKPCRYASNPGNLLPASVARSPWKGEAND